MASNGTHNDFINITTPHSRAPSMIQDTPASAPRPRLPVRKQAPQRNIDEFWNKFTTKHPGKIFTILPDNLYAKRAAAHAPRGSIPGVNALASYEEAKEACTRKVAKIVKECRRLNQKYRDPHFDIEADFKRSQAIPDTPADCLTGLSEEKADFHPLSVKRVEVCMAITAIVAWLIRHRTFSTNHDSSSKAPRRTMYGRGMTATAGLCRHWQRYRTRKS
jgi:hypothetical protein